MLTHEDVFYRIARPIMTLHVPFLFHFRSRGRGGQGVGGGERGDGGEQWPKARGPGPGLEHKWNENGADGNRNGTRNGTNMEPKLRNGTNKEPEWNNTR